MTTKLFVQGGGMRGLYSLAVLARLEELGMANHFSVVEGASAGAINGTYFVAGQASEAVRVYTDMPNSRQFIKFTRVTKILDVDFLVDVVLKEVYPLHLDQYWGSRTEMRTILTDASTAQEFIATNRMRDIDVYELLRATAALPLLYHKRVTIRGTEYVDGGVSRALPSMDDLSSGRPMLVVLTRPLSFRKSVPSALHKACLTLRSGSMSAELHRELKQIRVFNETMAHLERLDEQSPVRVIAPTDVKLIANRTTRNRDRLTATVERAREDLDRSLGGWIGL